MARYELAGAFWSIALGGRAGRSGATLTMTAGKIGNKGRTTTRTYASAGAAEAAHDELVREKLRAGYQLVEPPAADRVPVADAAAAALEASIAADPSDPAAYAVYADWLQRQGDPRGELIALQLA